MPYTPVFRLETEFDAPERAVCQELRDESCAILWLGPKLNGDGGVPDRVLALESKELQRGIVHFDAAPGCQFGNHDRVRA